MTPDNDTTFSSTNAPSLTEVPLQSLSETDIVVSHGLDPTQASSKQRQTAQNKQNQQNYQNN